MDCGDNSCLFAPKRGGMRTNGGCRCLDAIEDRALMKAIKRAFLDTRADGYRAGIEAAAKVAEKARREHSRLSGQFLEKCDASRDYDYCMCEMAHVRDAIRALAPAATTEKT